MDQLYWDTFGHHEHDVHDDDDDDDDDMLFFYQALQQLIRQCPCPCRRFQQDSGSVSHCCCVRCKVLLHALFARRQLEIVSSHQASARSSDQRLTVEAAALSEEELIGDGVLDNLRWDENDSDESDDDKRTRPEELEVPDRLPRWRDASDAEQSDYYSFNNTTDDTSDYAETEQLGAAESDIIGNLPEFNLPALQLVWETFKSHHHQQIPRRPRNTTNLRRAAQITFGQSYGKGTAHAVGLFANCDDPSIWLRLGCWIRRRKETWLHTSRIGYLTLVHALRSRNGD
jgi:hypothetical protein